MKLFVVAALIAVTSAARLEHLERSYLPPDNNNVQGSFGNNGLGSNIDSGFGNGLNTGTHGLSNGNSGTNGFTSNGRPSNGFASNYRGSNGNGHRTTFASNGNNGFGSNGGSNGNSAATSNQYLPPFQGTSGSGNGFPFGGSSIKPACSTCGPSRYTQQYNQGSPSIPSTNYGVPQFGSTFGSNGSPGSSFGSSGPSDSNFGSAFGSSNGNFGSNSFGSQGAANRQYLAPKPSSQNPPQQAFDEKYGYIY